MPPHREVRKSHQVGSISGLTVDCNKTADVVDVIFQVPVRGAHRVALFRRHFHP